MPRLRRLRAAWIASALLVAPHTSAAFSLELSEADFTSVTPIFSSVTAFQLAIELSDPLLTDRVYDNADLVEVEYFVSGALSQSPPTPSGFPAFALNRTATGEGTIDDLNWEMQGSTIDFEIAPAANLADGLQLSELVADVDGVILRIDGREFERLDRARYHPPRLLLLSNGTGTIENSNNSSGSTGTTNPGTGLTVNVDFGDEYITDLTFDPASVTLVPEPAAPLLAASALSVLAGIARSRATARSTPDRS